MAATTDTTTSLELSDQDWDDVADMVAHFKACTDWLDIPRQRADYERRSPDHIIELDRRRALAERIIAAVSAEVQ